MLAYIMFICYLILKVKLLERQWSCRRLSYTLCTQKQKESINAWTHDVFVFLLYKVRQFKLSSPVISLIVEQQIFFAWSGSWNNTNRFLCRFAIAVLL
jgi:hypothetical protein